MLFVCIVVWIAWFCRLPLLRHDRFQTFGFDLGIYDQGVWLLSQFRDPFVTVRGLDLFGHHMNVILLVLAPLYRLGGGVEFLLARASRSRKRAARSRCSCSGAICLRSRWCGVALAIALLLNPTYQWLMWEFFHPDAVAIGPLLFAYWAARQRRWGWFAVAAVIALECKEDVALAVVVLGLLFAFRLRRDSAPARVRLRSIIVGLSCRRDRSTMRLEVRCSPPRIRARQACMLVFDRRADWRIGTGIALSPVPGSCSPPRSSSRTSTASVGSTTASSVATSARHRAMSPATSRSIPRSRSIG